MSGGVDSSVAAYILKKKGYNVEGVYMKNWDIRDELGRCTSDKDWSDVQKVCEQLEISCTRIDLVKEYWNRIFENVIEQYETGFTPNPDIMCNSEIKFGVLLEKLRNKTGRFGDDDIWFATGHYARIDQRPGETPRLFRGVDSSKDQSFFLSGVKAGSLQNVIFPLGELRKRDQVRQIALDLKLITAEKEESMGICFIGERKRFSEFMCK
ncbi:tRNA-specific 2-thiouridylase MnmA [Zancudomyces culisetae]|uniref:tRNA-5-taurinomethyluridine 2-sulfurtransferase n=1 Tax=Zancudomyces culisetae TaxID=1213189 RepID=A0A1R1PHX6_ZANCU|nr:tRNA-specific 2-thiouridylase MnmA [Zancudomyces culisetae]|eukprot:OMH80529.1 tRNA-specific 2-thiouridylase MnmA [Zancudomyces culisetae]